MKQRTVIRIISLLTAVILAIGGLWIKEMKKSRKYLLQIENEYSSSLSKLNSSLNNISLILEKTAYVNTARQISSYSAELYSESELAKEALSALPTGEDGLNTVYEFLSQVGNYALSVSKKMISGESITAEQKQNLIKLGDTARTVSQVISDSQLTFNNNEYWANELESRIDGIVKDSPLAQSLNTLEQDLSDYPTLIYDGPYSDHILTKEPLMTANATTVSKDEAHKIAQSLLSKKSKLKYDGLQSGKIDCYRFINDDVTVTVSKNGGYLVYMRKNRIVGETVLSYEQSLEKAKRFMNDNGFKGMTDTYYYSDEGVCVINFAYLDGQTICYTDLIKVGVALDTGEIMFYESSGYLTNHTERAFETPTYTPEQATETISADLSVETISVALIPTDGGGEVRCYEFLCKTADEREILIYTNVQTLDIEHIYILLRTDGGTLVK